MTQIQKTLRKDAVLPNGICFHIPLKATYSAGMCTTLALENHARKPEREEKQCFLSFFPFFFLSGREMNLTTIRKARAQMQDKLEQEKKDHQQQQQQQKQQNVVHSNNNNINNAGGELQEMKGSGNDSSGKAFSRAYSLPDTTAVTTATGAGASATGTPTTAIVHEHPHNNNSNSSSNTRDRSASVERNQQQHTSLAG